MNGFSRALFLLLSLSLFVALAGVSVADESRLPDVSLVAPAVRHLIQGGDYPAAVAAIDKAIGAEPAAADHLLYLKGRVLQWDGQFQAAAETFTSLIDRYPDSVWRRRAEFAAGQASVSRRDFRAAETLYRSAATALLAEERKHELAEICLEFADIDFGPGDDDREPPYRQPRQGYHPAADADDDGPEPNFQQARKFYEQALEMGVKQSRRSDVELRVARCLQEVGSREAADAYEAFIEEHPDSPLVVEARYRLGQCHLAADELKLARWAWQDLLAAHGNDPSKQIAEASFDLSRTWGLPEPSSDAEMELGIATLERFLQHYPTHRLAGRAHLDIARSWMYRGRYEDAAVRLEQLLDDQRYHDSDQGAEARDLLGQAYREQGRFADALAAWRQFLTDYPADSQWSQVQQQVVDSQYMLGLDRFQADDYDAARRVLAQFMGTYPLDARVPGVLVLLGRVDYEQKRFDAAIATWKRVVSKYPNSHEAAYSQYRIGTVLERELDDPPAALEAYQKVTWGGRYGSKARCAIARLTDKTMTITTQRVFRSDETPKIKLTTRNLQSVDVRVYGIDIPSYFRKVHAMENIDQLDIALIDPTAKFQFPIADYVPYQELQRTIEIPLPDGATRGAVAVTVASETHEATTLVLQSDLDLIVKSAGDDVFVFAQNMVTGKPWPGAQLLISDGAQIIAQGVTGEDGVFRGMGGQGIATGRPSVLAMADGHVNSIRAFAAPRKHEDSVSDRGYIFTDRPVYATGQTVHIRGCVCQVQDDHDAVESGQKFRLQVKDPRDRTIHDEGIVLNKFGSFHASFLLPPSTPPGEHQIVVGDGKKRRYQGSFLVQEIQPKLVRLSIELPRRVYYRGETVEGVIHAVNDAGAPLAARDVAYQLADGRRHTARTNEEGQVSFALETRDIAASGKIQLAARFADQNTDTTANLFLATQGFSIKLDTPRNVFVVGEPIQAMVATTDAAGKPVERTLHLKVSKRTALNGRVIERLVHEQAFETTSDDGLASPTIHVDQGGDYRLRVEGTDRFGNIVSAEREIAVSDETDRIRLRVLADQHHFRVGDTTEVTLHWRGAPALALVTYETTEVLDYQLVPLATGVNRLPVRMDARYVPNFNLVANVMTDPRTLRDWNNRDEGVSTIWFHEASCPFIVQRDLDLNVTWVRQNGTDGPPRPGDRMQVAIRTSDSQRQPVSAEVSLAMVDQAILNQFPCPLPKIQDFFRPPIEESNVCTDSSIEFSCYPATTAINPRLLTERQREELARQEQASLQHGPGGLGGGFGGMDMGRGTRGDSPDEDASRNWGEYGDDFLSLIDVIDREIGDCSAGVTASGDNPTPAVHSFLQRDGATNDDQQTADESITSEIRTDWTAYWNPSIVTDSGGQATVEITIPEPARSWTLVAKGVTQNVLIGEVAANVTVQPKDLFGELRLPSVLTQGDTTQVVAAVHASGQAKGNIPLTLSTEIDGHRNRQRKQVSLDGSGIYVVPFDLILPQSGAAPTADQTANLRGAVRLRLSVGQGELQDVVEQRVPLRPDGLVDRSTIGGVAAEDVTLWVEADNQVASDTRQLQILISPTVHRALLDVLADDPTGNRRNTRAVALSTGRTAADLMAAVGLKDLLASEPVGSDATHHNLDPIIRTGIGHLISSQNSDGGWGWSAPGTASGRQTSARALWALALARRAGYPVSEECLDGALKFVDGQVAATENRDFENKAILLHALSTAGKGEFFLANRLYRERESLSASALLYLALAFAEMDRKETARELLAGVTLAHLDEASKAATASVGRSDRTHRAEVLNGLYLLAVQAAELQGVAKDDLAGWLLGHRSGHRWSPDEATGPAALALCHWAQQNRVTADSYRLEICVNDVLVATLEADGTSETRVIDVPKRHLVEGRQKIDFQPDGDGRYTYQVELVGAIPADQLASTTNDWFVRRTYEPAPLEVDGREIPRGFDIVEDTTGRFRNRLTQLPTGESGRVVLWYGRTAVAPEQALSEPEQYLVITEPIPGGTEVVPNSVRGAFEHYEVSGGEITIYLGRQWKPSAIGYEIRGCLPGQYRVPPAVAWNAYRPEQMAISTAGALTVLPRNVESTDAYQLTPEELFHLGELAIKRGDMAAAETHLTQLLHEWNLKPATYRQVVGMLLKVELVLGKPDDVIRYFEIIQERWPDERIALNDGMKIAAAYDQLGEFERSYLGFRAIVESNFKQESSMAGFLESQKRFLAAVGLMERLLDEYPPEAYAATAHYALAQQVFAASSTVEENPELVDAGVNRVDLVTHAWRLLEDFLTDHAENPTADHVAFSAANALLDLEQFSEAAAACQRYTSRYSDSKLLDGLWYMLGYCRFADGQPEPAIAALERVVELTAGDSGERANSNRWAALFILGQIYHSLDQPAKAIEYYRRVEDHFPDARKSIEYFLRKTIRFDEVTTRRPGELVEVELTYRNIASCDVRVYRIDLMKFALLHEDLGSIAQVNLAGIEPQVIETITLGDGQDYRDRTHSVALDVDAEGAYLIVCRGADSYASGLLLISPLEIEVQYEGTDEEARVILRDAVADDYVRDADVRVMGGWSADLVSGRTDQRGLFLANGVGQDPTVIAMAGPGRYAFRRGTPSGAILPPELARQLHMTDLTVNATAGDIPDSRPSAGVPLSGGAEQAAERRILATLEMPTAVSFEDTPLEDVTRLLSKQHGIPIMLDTRALDDVGIGTDVPVTFAARGITLRSALRLILKELDLTYVIRDECLLISTPEEAESELVTMIYPVRDLVRFQDTEGQGWADFDTLIDMITSTVAPTSWDTVGGPGAIEGMSYKNTDVMILSQTQDVHEQIEQVLTRLRSVAGDDDGEGELPVRERPSWSKDGFQGMGGFGGMGGMGMGGGAFGGPSPATNRTPQKRNELLRGLQDAQRDLQGREIRKLRSMYDQGGMGGGVGAGGFF